MDKKILVVCGTRAEALQLAPVAIQARECGFNVKTVLVHSSLQHESCADIFSLFSLSTDYQIDCEISEVLFAEAPDAVLIHGTGTVAFSTSLAALLQKIPIGLVGSGQRSWVECGVPAIEMQEKFIHSTARWHFAATPSARRALVCDGVSHDLIFQTGSAAVDSAMFAYEHIADVQKNLEFLNNCLKPEALSRVLLGQFVVVALQGEGKSPNLMLQNFAFLKRMSHIRRDLQFFVFCDDVARSLSLTDKESHADSFVTLLPQLDVVSECYLVSRCRLVISDSVRFLDEAPVFGKHVIVVSESTDRIELLETKLGRLVETDSSRMMAAAMELLCAHRPIAVTVPGGDGAAAQRIVKILKRDLSFDLGREVSALERNSMASQEPRGFSKPLRANVG